MKLIVTFFFRVGNTLTKKSLFTEKGKKPQKAFIQRPKRYSEI